MQERFPLLAALTGPEGIESALSIHCRGLDAGRCAHVTRQSRGLCPTGHVKIIMLRARSRETGSGFKIRGAELKSGNISGPLARRVHLRAENDGRKRSGQ